MRHLALGLSLLLVSSAAPALAQEGGGGGQGWSVLSGQTVGQDALVFHAEFGVPGLNLNLLYGATDKLDLGGRFGVRYLYEGITRSTLPGITLQALIRLQLLERKKFNLALTFEPGPYFYFNGSRRFYRGFFVDYAPGTVAGFAFPVALTVGIPVGSALMVNAGLDVPFHVPFGSFSGPFIPILFGAGLEYFIDRSLGLTLNMRTGPQIDTYFNTTHFTLEFLFGVAIKL